MDALLDRDAISEEAIALSEESGMVFINHPALSRPELPFGGIKRSGYGRELGDLGMMEFANRKLVCTLAPTAPIGSFAG